MLLKLESITILTFATTCYLVFLKFTASTPYIIEIWSKFTEVDKEMGINFNRNVLCGLEGMGGGGAF